MTRKAQRDVTIDGSHFMRALAYAEKVAPSSEGMGRLAHVVFHQARIIGSDGRLWLVGRLPPEAALAAPFAATKESCSTLLLALEFARRMAKQRGTSFHVELQPGELDDHGSLRELAVQIVYGGKFPIVHELSKCPVGYIPEEWEEPVAPDAPQADTLEFEPGQMKQAVEWYRSWERDHGTVSFGLRGKGGPQRLDMICGGDLVANAFILPSTWPPATLVHDEPLFEKLNPGKRVGQSILDLQLDRDGQPAPKKIDKLEIDGHEINVRGLEDPEGLIVRGKCVHDAKRKKEEACWQCTSDAVKAARKALKKKKQEEQAEEDGADAPAEH